MPVDQFGGQKYQKIRKQLLEQKGLFQDNLFPPNLTSLGDEIVKKLHGRHVEWKRPFDLIDKPKLFVSENTRIVSGEFSAHSIVECLQHFSSNRELCFKTIVNSGAQEFEKEGYTGLFRFRFWKFCRWTDIVIDDLLPTIDNQLIFTQSFDGDVFWVPLIEKAYAKLLGSYEAIEQNEVSDILVDITGGISSRITVKSEVVRDEEARFDLFQGINVDLTAHSIVCASISVGEGANEGLVKGRLYGITAVRKVHVADLKIRNLFRGRERVAVIRLKDPTGTINSAFSSPTRSVDSTTESGDEADGNKLWNRLRLRLDRDDSEICDNILQNPQFLIKINQDTEDLVLQLLQTLYPRFPISLTIFRAEQNRKFRLHKQWGFTPTIVELEHESRREISHKISLARGRYLVIPNAKTDSGTFLLRAVARHNCNLREVTSDIPSNFCGLSCVLGSAMWVTVMSIRSVEGLSAVRNVFCSIKCEKQRVKTEVCHSSRNISWNEAFVFYRKNSEKPIMIKVFSKNQLTTNLFLGQVEIQARVNHSPTLLEVALNDKQGNCLQDVILKAEILTEDDLYSV